MTKNSTPQIISIIKRKLKKESSYEDFRKAWLPKEADYYRLPVWVINAQGIHDKDDIISIGLIDAALEEVYQEGARTGEWDRLRGEGISAIADSYGNAELYQVKDSDELFSPCPEATVRPMIADDIDELVARFQAASWPKPKKLFEKYLHEQKHGQRAVWVAQYQEMLVGYVTLLWRSDYPAFKEHQIPEVKDLNVLPEFRKKGIGSALLDEAEKEAKIKSKAVGLGVGLYRDYGSAQRLYVTRGYLPDGNGITYNYESVEPGSSVPIDDDAVLWFVKQLR